MANDVGPLWYNSGTATVAQGDTLVTFQNEGNLYDIVRAGDDFGAHVQRPTRIKSIDQATSQATLAYPWPGPSQTAAPYEISFNPQISAYRIAVRTILRLLKSGNVAALAGLVGAAGKVPFFTGPGQMDLTDKIDVDVLSKSGNAAGAGERVLLGVIRQETEGGGWSFIDNAGHTPVNFDTSGITATDALLALPYKFTGNTVRTVIAVPDETYAQRGLTVGASVSRTECRLKFALPLNASIRWDPDGGVAYLGDPAIIPDISASASGPELTVTHGYIPFSRVPPNLSTHRGGLS